MPRTAVPVTEITRTGVAPAAQVAGDASNDHDLPNDSRTWVEVQNLNVAAVNVTFVTPGNVSGQAIDDQVVSVPGASTRLVGPFPTSLFGETLQIDVATNAADLRFRAFRLGPSY